MQGSATNTSIRNMTETTVTVEIDFEAEYDVRTSYLADAADSERGIKRAFKEDLLGEMGLDPETMELAVTVTHE